MYFMPAPELVSVKCPQCEQHATFRKSIGIANVEKVNRPYFEKSKDFDTFYTKHYGRYQYEVWYDTGLGNNIDNIRDLPDGINPKHFKPSSYSWPLRKYSRGVIACNHCTLRRRINIDWPKQAYFTVEYKGKVLWAYNREMALAILEYLKNSSRKKLSQSARNQTSYAWLSNLPTVFQTKKATPTVVRKLEKLLG
ncbi:hypothetical protein N9W89_04000 [Hellea sp.]|nr:hypothetical protein [Hellea sp.]